MESSTARLAPEASPAHAPVPYLQALRAYAGRDALRLMVPGHKGGRGAPPALSAALGEALAIDLPALMAGIDLGEDSPLARARVLAAEAWGAARTWFLLNGASQGNHAACLALAGLGARDVVVQRNVHASVVDGLVLSGLRPHWVAPEVDDELGVAHGVTPAALDRALAAAPGARAALVVSPTYHGAVADVRALAEVAHAHAAALLVDEAWGAHLAFAAGLPEHAVACGADLVLSSTHKSLGSLSGSAMLHHGPAAERWLPASAVARGLALTETTSPLSLGLASLDAARARAERDGPAMLRRLTATLAATRRRLRLLPGVRVLGPDIEGRPGVHGFDPLRLTIDITETGRDARAVARALHDRGVDLEFATDRLLVAAFGIGDADLGVEERLPAALLGALWSVVPERRRPRPWTGVHAPEQVLTPRDAWLARHERVALEDAGGRVAAESLSPYPPGIPALLPGERCDAETLAALRAVADGGGFVRGAPDAMQTVAVVAG